MNLKIVSATPTAGCRSGELWLPSPFTLDAGGRLLDACLAWQLSGPADAPLVLVLGGISAHRSAADRGADQRGWWREQCGVGKTLDPRRNALLGIDWLGGSHDSSGPRGCVDFPQIGTRDQARAILLLLDGLGIERVHLLVGASFGGCVAQHLAQLLGTRLRRLFLIGAAHRATHFAVGLRHVQREVLALGQASACAPAALAAARSLAMLSYRTPEEFEDRFADGAAVVSYLRHQGARFAQSYDAVAAALLACALDQHNFEPATLVCPTTLVAIASDQLVPPWLVREFAGGCAQAEYVLLASRYGHDAFIKEERAVASLLRRALIGLETCA